MEQNKTFKMTYSAQQQEEIQSIREKYVPREASKMEQLRALDAAVSQKATMISIILGVIGALLLGAGMSLFMTELGEALGSAALPLGIVVGLVGLLLAALAYPAYQRILRRERQRIAPEILRLSDELLN